MDISELLDAAKRKQGRYQDIAEKLGVKPPRISEWKKGVCAPDTSQIALIAEMAGLPVLETVAEVEHELRPGTAVIWERLVSKAKAAGVAASAILILGMGFPAEKANAHNDLRAQGTGGVIYIVASMLRTLVKWLSGQGSRFATV